MRIDYSCMQQYRWISQTKCWGKKKPECIFYCSIYRKFKNRQNESAVMEFRGVITFGKEFAEKVGGILGNVYNQLSKKQNPWFYIICQFPWCKYFSHGGFQATNVMPLSRVGKRCVCIQSDLANRNEPALAHPWEVACRGILVCRKYHVSWLG